MTEPRNKKRTSDMMKKKLGRLDPTAVKSINKDAKAATKGGKGQQVKVTSSTMRVTKTNSAKKTSVPNKIKAQGKAMTKSPTSNYNRRGK